MESRATTPARNAAIARLEQLDHNRKALLKRCPQVIGKIQRLEDDLIAGIEANSSEMKIEQMRDDLEKADRELEETNSRWDMLEWEVEALMAEIWVGKAED